MIPRSLAIATSVANPATGPGNAQTTSKTATSNVRLNNVKATRAIAKDLVPTTIETLAASQDGVPRHLLQELQPPRRPTLIPFIGARHANDGRPHTPRKRTQEPPAEQTHHQTVLQPP